MNVFILTYTDREYHTTNVIGVFSTREKAIAYFNKVKNHEEYWYDLAEYKVDATENIMVSADITLQ